MAAVMTSLKNTATGGRQWNFPREEPRDPEQDEMVNNDDGEPGQGAEHRQNGRQEQETGAGTDRPSL